MRRRFERPAAQPPETAAAPHTGTRGRAGLWQRAEPLCEAALLLWGASLCSQALLWRQSLLSALPASALLPGLLLHQTQFLLVALCVASVRALARWPGVLLALLLALYTAADLVAFRVGHRHLSFGMTERAPDATLVATMWASFVEEADAVAVVSFFVGALAAARLARRPSPGRYRQHAHLPGPAALVVLGLLLLSAPSALRSERPGPCFDSPVVQLLRPSASASASGLLVLRAEAQLPPSRSADDLYAPYLPREEGASEDGGGAEEEDDAVAAWLRAEGAAERRPDVLLFTHEGVGARNVLPEGLPDAEMAPFLAELQRQPGSVLFPQVYTSFPSTLRSFVPMMVGGRVGTKGDILGQTAAPFQGASVVSTARELGYRTGLFASGKLGFEGLDVFLQGLGFDRYFDFNSDPEWREQHRLSTWGARDDETAEVALGWAAAQPAQDPLFLQFFPCGTHHPYRTRGGAKSYPRTVTEADAVLRQLVEGLEARGRPLLVVVNSDHGEAFGDAHKGNKLHKNFLYEENVRVFLLMAVLAPASPATAPGPLVSPRLLRHGDLLPTLRFVLGAPAAQEADQHGRNALAPAAQWRPQLAFFHKTAGDLAMGLRDGRWKFVTTLLARSQRRQAELYDLFEDPLEQRNLALDVRRDWEEDLAAITTLWFNRIHCDWLATLDSEVFPDCEPEDALAQALAPGPTKLGFGNHEDGQVLVAQPARLSATKNFGIWTEWTPYPVDTWVRFRLSPSPVSPPSGAEDGLGDAEEVVFDFKVKKGWHTTRYRFPVTALAAGRWRLSVLQAGFLDVLLEREVEVVP